MLHPIIGIHLHDPPKRLLNPDVELIPAARLEGLLADGTEHVRQPTHSRRARQQQVFIVRCFEGPSVRGAKNGTVLHQVRHAEPRLDVGRLRQAVISSHSQAGT